MLFNLRRFRDSRASPSSAPFLFFNLLQSLLFFNLNLDSNAFFISFFTDDSIRIICHFGLNSKYKNSSVWSLIIQVTLDLVWNLLILYCIDLKLIFEGNFVLIHYFNFKTNIFCIFDKFMLLFVWIKSQIQGLLRLIISKSKAWTVLHDQREIKVLFIFLNWQLEFCSFFIISFEND